LQNLIIKIYDLPCVFILLTANLHVCAREEKIPWRAREFFQKMRGNVFEKCAGFFKNARNFLRETRGPDTKFFDRRFAMVFLSPTANIFAVGG
jgi:hypothetical protein